MSVRLSANGAGATPLACNLARTKASIGLRIADCGLAIAGTAGRVSGCQHQCSALRLARSNSLAPAVVVAGASFGHGAPISTHFVKTAISSAGSFDFGGI